MKRGVAHFPEVGQIARDGLRRREEINRRPEQDEISHAFDAARRAGLWRFDQRRGVAPELAT